MTPSKPEIVRGYIMKVIFTAAAFAVLFIMLSGVAIAQSSLTGVVTDSLTHEKLVGVNVILVGTGIGNATNIEGEYRITNIPQKSYEVKISCIGYIPKTMVVDFARTTSRRLDVQLSPTVIEGQEVVITAQMRGQVAAMNRQVSSNTIVNVVSEEKIKELPDANAAEAIGRLPGVSILRSGGEANKVILRGLSDQYTVVTIDGVRIPPTDANSRGVDLSTLSQGSLAGIELQKALTSDQDADAIAGSVNLVTKKASTEGLYRVDVKGGYNNLMNSYNQYDLALRLEQRFFDDVLGVQVTGNLEKRIRSNEATDITYANFYPQGRAAYYRIGNFTLDFTDEVRKRDGVGVVFDLNTPDKGSVRLSTNYSSTSRSYIYRTRNYASRDANNYIYYATRDRDQETNTFNSSLRGENYLLGMTLTWGASFAQSISSLPYDYYINFKEPSTLDAKGNPISGMGLPPNFSITDNPESMIPYAMNNFAVAGLDTGTFRTEDNLDKEKTAFIDLSRKYTVGDWISGEVKLGGKYKYKNRFRESSRLYAPYFLNYWQEYTRVDDGTYQKKNFTGTWFDGFYKRYVANPNQRIPSASDFLDPTPAGRDLFGLYSLKPLVIRDALRLWYDLNKNGNDASGRSPEYSRNNTVDVDYYDIVERISGAYVMNTLNFGQAVTFIAGVRVESEQNDYKSRFAPSTLGGFPTPKGTIKDTASSYAETIWLPNFHLTFRPFEFLHLRFAAYRELARPDFNARLQKFVSQGGGTNTLIIGNDHLRASKAWNYEINTSFLSNTIGLITVSAFYKDIADMFHFLSGAGTVGNTLLDTLGIRWRSPFGGSSYAVTVPYNSSKPTRVWGFELEHQANLNFLPGYLQNIVLSYNASIVRSETHLLSTTTDTTFKRTPTGFPPPDDYILLPYYSTRVIEIKQKMEGQPEFYGNIALGYDIGGFSARLSWYYQGEFNRSFSADSKNDRITNSFSRLDLTIKQKITDRISVLLSLNNLTDTEERTTIANRIENWRLPDTNERYGITGDIGVRVEF